jgi:Xaa-Pro dipeptidase
MRDSSEAPSSREGQPLPAALVSQAARGLTEPPITDAGWRALHRNHVARLQAATGSVFSKMQVDGIVIHSGRSALKYSGDDQHWPSVATPSFFHWLPFSETPALLLLRPESKPKLFCEAHSSFWDGPAPVNECWSRESFDIEQVDDLSAVKLSVETSIKHSSAIAFVGDEVKLALSLGIPAEQCNRSDLQAMLESFRTLKSDFEVASMRAANKTAVRGHTLLKGLFEAGQISELALHHAYLRETRQTDFTVPYGNIVALGNHCGILHHVHYEDVGHVGDLSFLVDAGATCNGYASDITRTWVRGSGAAAGQFGELLIWMNRIQKTLIQGVVVGKDYENLHNESHFLLAEALKAIGLVNCGIEEMVASGLTRVFFPHGLGHSLGLQVHDVGMRLTKAGEKNPYLRNTSVITAGQVVTIEPGCYFIPSQISGAMAAAHGRFINTSTLEALRPFGGIRIEDNILATQTGPVNITGDLFSDV